MLKQNEIAKFEGVEEGGATIYEWDWTFGDGGTAIGRRVWHAFYDVNDEEGPAAAWKVTVTAVDNRGNVSSAARTVQVQPETGDLAAYARKEVGLDCLHSGTNEPEIPAVSRVNPSMNTANDECWQLESGQTAYLVVKLSFVPETIYRVGCRWYVYACSLDGSGWPELVAEIDGGVLKNHLHEETKQRTDAWYRSYVGFNLEIGSDSLTLPPGWYLVCSEVTPAEPITLDRNIYSFRLHIVEPVNEE
ncbi:PKD domain-containing protein [Candidatus Bipolaricaulota bacterium]|nr:PKD domain-containing protein [Candidatus Bipolaricaulota bacterium]